MILEQFQQMGFKSETVELTPETLLAADFPVAWHTIGGVVPVDSMNERRVRRAALSPLQPVGGAFVGNASGTFEPVPSGTDGTAPAWYQLLAAAGGTVSTDVVTFGAQATSYAPIGKACTIEHRDGAYQRILAGARIETMRFYAERGDLWLCDFTAVGRYSQTAQANFLSPSLPSINGKPFLGHVFSIGGSAVDCASLEILITNVISPVQTGAHASGNGKNVITEQRCTLTAVILDEGMDYREKHRNDAAGDLLAISAQMSVGSAGSVLTWTGNLAVMDNPAVEYREGNGYRTIAGEFVASSTGAILTLTQS